ncbi:MAG TPA: hypothetical protein VK586_16225 [Streptosporangiaceae bacterium]|nr:hypothetical protein [Streptosporangiaceae bacterium]
MDMDTTTRPAAATLACGHDILTTPAQEDAGQAYHCGQFRGITRLPGEAGPDTAMLAALTGRQADLLGAKFRAAYVGVAALKDGAGFRTPEWDSLDALWDDLHGLACDANAAEYAAHEREAGPALVADARRHNHLKSITDAERLLAAERTAAGTP